MTLLEARDSDGQVIPGQDLAHLAERTAHAGDQYTSWSIYEVTHTAAGTEPQKTCAGFMIAGSFVTLADREAGQ